MENIQHLTSNAEVRKPSRVRWMIGVVGSMLTGSAPSDSLLMSPCCGRVATATPPQRGHFYRVIMGTFSRSSDTTPFELDVDVPNWRKN